jgi:hypothetical protein
VRPAHPDVLVRRPAEPRPRCQWSPVGSGRNSISSPVGRLPLGIARLALSASHFDRGNGRGRGDSSEWEGQKSGQPIPDGRREMGSRCGTATCRLLTKLGRPSNAESATCRHPKRSTRRWLTGLEGGGGRTGGKGSLDWWTVDTYSSAWHPPVPAGESRRWTRQRCNLTALGGAGKWQNETRRICRKRGCRGEEEVELAKSERSDGEQGRRARPLELPGRYQSTLRPTAK